MVAVSLIRGRFFGQTSAKTEIFGLRVALDFSLALTQGVGLAVVEAFQFQTDRAFSKIQSTGLVIQGRFP